jgi:anti-sigma B factor antagonist
VLSEFRAVPPTCPCHDCDSGGHTGLAPWPGPAELADGSLAIATTAPRPSVLVVRAIGEIDLLTAPAWRRVLAAATRSLASTRLDDAAPELVCDLSPVSFLGASGLDVLVVLAEEAARRRVRLRVVAPGRRVRRPLELTGLDRHLAIETRLDEAVAPGWGATRRRDAHHRW